MFSQKDIKILIILIGITLLFFVEALSGDWTFGYGDIHRYFYPIRYFTACSIKEGILPFWNPYIYGGMPNLAALQPAVFYPLSILTYIFPFFIGIELFIITHFTLAAFFTYLLMRSFEVSKTSALISAITYGFGGFLLSVVDMLTTLSAATWTPLIFLCYTKALTYTSNRYFILTGLFLGIQFLAGEPTQLYGSLIALTLYWLYWWLYWGQTLKVEFRLSKFFQGLTPWLICLGLTLFQVIPFLEMVFHSTRTAGLKFTHATSLSLGPQELLNLILPYFTGNFIDENHFWFGQSWLDSIYAGILPFMLAFSAIIFLRKKVIFWIVLLLIFLVLSFGKLFPVYELLYKYLPGFSMIRYPVKFFSFVAFAGSILAGFGYEHLIKEKNNKFLNLFTIFILIYGVGFSLFFLNHQAIIPFLKKMYFPNSLDIQIAVWSNSLLANFIVVSIIIISGSLFIFLLVKDKISLKIFNFGIIGLVIVDLFLFGVRINPFVSQNIYAYKSDGLRFILQDRDCYRILLEPESEKYFHIIRGNTLEDALLGVQKALVSNYGLFYKIFDAQGYESITLNDYEQVLEMIQKEGGGNLLNMLNIKYIISKFELKMEQLKLVYEDEAIKIYWNTTCLPRAFFVSKARVIDRNRILEVMKSRDFNPEKEVIVEQVFSSQFLVSSNEVDIKNSKLKTINSKLKFINYQPNKVTIKTSSSVDSILFLSDTYYPGWNAYIDGKPTKVYRANYAFRAINVTAGEHKVEFVYFPLSFLIGSIGSVITVIILIIVSVQISGIRYFGSRYSVFGRNPNTK